LTVDAIEARVRQANASQRFTVTDERPAEKSPALVRRGMRSVSYLERSAQA
jgi:hypothetical protein